MDERDGYADTGKLAMRREVIEKIAQTPERRQVAHEVAHG
jgi:hypothetical protein